VFPRSQWILELIYVGDIGKIALKYLGRQILIGCKKAKTKYVVAMAVKMMLVPYEHFYT